MPVRLSIDADRRTAIRANHSATHLVHAALRRTLGDHVVQKGSLVAPDRLRFDFAHPKPVSEDELVAVEDMANAVILQDASVDTLSPGETLTYEADNTGATATCDALGAEGDTWHAFDLTEAADVSTSKCGTSPVWGNAFIVIDTDCPCSGAFIFADAFDQTTCADGNWTVHYNSLPAGDYWAPEIHDPSTGNNDGKYIFNITAATGIDT